MGRHRLDASGLTALSAALTDTPVVARYRAKIVQVPGSDCWWWTGAVSGRGHGRFWFAPGRVAIAHRVGFALVHGVDAAAAVEVLGHRCDNPLCQRVDPDHIGVSSHLQNRREWAARRTLTGSPLGDPQGARARARQLRDLARQDPVLLAVALRRAREVSGEQQVLW